MRSLDNIEYVRTLKSNMRATLDTDAGKEVMLFLEDLCGWYDFKQTEPNRVLVAHGKRQVLATIKTLLKLTPEQIVAYVQKESE